MQIVGRPQFERVAVHHSITELQISELVDQFYEAILANAKLAPIFTGQMTGDWDVHLEKMKSFWRSVLLKSGEYKGKPVPVHAKIEGIETEDFHEWLNLFAKTSADIFQPEAAIIVNETAQRIATSLWLARSSDPFDKPPQWSKSR